MRFLYTAILYILTPVFLIRLFIRARKAPFYLKRWQERFAIYRNSDRLAPVIWVHAVSVGEVEAAFPLVLKLQQSFPQFRLLLTTTTPTGSSRIKSLLGETVEHVYLPYDLPVCLERFYRRFKPALGVVMETEIWPNLFFLARAFGTPIIIVNARMSEKSKSGYGCFRSFVRSTLAHVSCIAAQTRQDADRFIQIGAESEKLHVTGNIKFDLVLPENILNQSSAIRENVLMNRPVLVAASTHDDEEAQILDVLAWIRKEAPDLLLTLVPRHPERAHAVAKLCAAKGFSLVQRSTGKVCLPGTDIYLVDTLGELKLFYAASDIAFVGGSLSMTGGHNVLEPAALGIPIIVGPNTFNFDEVTRLLVDAKAAVRVNNRQDLAVCVVALMKNKRKRREMGERCRRFVKQNRGALYRTMKCIRKVMK